METDLKYYIDLLKAKKITKNHTGIRSFECEAKQDRRHPQRQGENQPQGEGETSNSTNQQEE